MSPGAKSSYMPGRPVEDAVLVRECLLGGEKAWSDLIDKYKNLIFSIPIKYGLSTEDAADIFQAVCLTLLRELSSVREPRALAAWLIKTTARKCLHWKHERQLFFDAQMDDEALADTEDLPETLMQGLEREQMLREAVAQMSPECARLIDLLFFRIPPLPYAEVAERLGFAKGSIGATRMRCLEKLRADLEKKGFK